MKQLDQTALFVLQFVIHLFERTVVYSLLEGKAWSFHVPKQIRAPPTTVRFIHNVVTFSHES